MKEKKGEHPFSDSGQTILLIIFLVVWIGDSFFLKKTTFISNYVPLYIRLIILGIMAIVVVYLIRSGHAAVERKSDSIITTGGFRYVRHPLYLGSVLSCFGLTIATLSIISFVLFIGIFIFYNYIAGYEEKLLDVKFGEEYKEYKKRTGRWIPKIVKKC
jgi:protein-S-isoprenylcysteine O-methyltransferase Ste14